MATLKLEVSKRLHAQAERAGLTLQQILGLIKEGGIVGLENEIYNRTPPKDPRKSQEEWVAYFNRQGKRMISAPDVYGSSMKFFDSLYRKVDGDMDDTDPLVSSTRVLYNANDLGAKIIHNFGSTVVKPTEIQLIVPVLGRASLAEALRSQKAVAYLQALFNTKDSAARIAKTLKRLSRNHPEDIQLFTPDQSDRKEHSGYAVTFYRTPDQSHVPADDEFRNILFCVDGGRMVDDKRGHSYGTSVNRNSRNN